MSLKFESLHSFVVQTSYASETKTVTPNHTTWVALVPMAELQEAKSGIAQGDMFWDKCGRGTVPIQETQSLSTLSLDLTPYLCRLGRVGETVPEDYGL